MKLLINTIVLFTFAIALSACVSEEGAREHAEKGDAAAKVGMMPGMMWKAIVYNTDAGKHMELGQFESRDECHQATQAHMDGHKQPKKGHPRFRLRSRKV